MSMQEEMVGVSLGAVLEEASRRAGVSRDQVRFAVLEEVWGLLGAVPREVRVRVEMPDRHPERAPEPSSTAGEEDEEWPEAIEGEELEGEELEGEELEGEELEGEELEGEELEGEDLEGEDLEGEERGEEAEEAKEATASGPEPRAEEVKALAAELLGLMELDLEVRLSEDEERLVVDVRGPDRDLLVSRQGETLDALQYIVSRMARRELDTRKRIQFESEGYRTERDEEIRRMALDAADKARRTGAIVRLPPLNPYERRLVHVTVGEQTGVRSESEGEGFTKRVSVIPGGRGARRGGRGGGRRRTGGGQRGGE